MGLRKGTLSNALLSPKQSAATPAGLSFLGMVQHNDLRVADKTVYALAPDQTGDNYPHSEADRPLYEAFMDAFMVTAELESGRVSSISTDAAARLAYQNQVASLRGGIVALKISSMLASEDWRTMEQICLLNVEETATLIAEDFLLGARGQATALTADQLRSLTYSIVDMLGYCSGHATVLGFVIFHKGSKPTAISLTRYNKERDKIRPRAPPKLTRHEHYAVDKFHREAMRKAQAELDQVGADAASGDDELSSGTSPSVTKRSHVNSLTPHEKKVVQNHAQRRLDSATKALRELGEWQEVG